MVASGESTSWAGLDPRLGAAPSSYCEDLQELVSVLSLPRKPASHKTGRSKVSGLQVADSGANNGRGPSLSPLCGLHVCHPNWGRRRLWPSQASPPDDSGGSVSTQSLCWKGGKCPRVLELASCHALGQSWGTRSLLTGPGKGHRATGRIRPVTAARGEGGSPDKARATGKEGRPLVPFGQPPLGVLV